MRTSSWVAAATVVLGACGGASLGSAETLEPSVLVAQHPAFYEGSVLRVTRGPRVTPPPPEYRHAPPRGPRPILGWWTIRGGGFEPEDMRGGQWSIGGKFTAQVGPAFRLGMSTDWQQRDSDQGSIVSSGTDPAGNPVTREVVLGETHTDLFPILAVGEFVLPGNAIQPYFGGGIGWQFLNVRGADYQTGYWYDHHYDGPAAQVYGGLEFAVAPRARLHGEAYYHGGEVDQDFIDPQTGYLFEENIRTNGWGVRGGFNFAF
jgi:hypothetical protein